MLRTLTSIAITTALALSVGCSLLSGVDDLEGNAGTSNAGAGGSAGSGGSGGSAGSNACTVEGGCVGCASCDAYCACTKPFAIDACKAAECPDAGLDAGTDAANDATSADADAEPDHCQDSLYVGATCSAINQPQACVDCINANCCQEFNDCFADDNCAKSYACWQKRCQGATDPNPCIQSECPCIVQSFNQMIAMSGCLQDKCTQECTF